MKVYNYHPQSKEYTGTTEVRIVGDCPIIPANSTTAQPSPVEGKVSVFNGQGWSNVVDMRRSFVYNMKTRERRVIKELGESITGYTPVEPPEFATVFNVTDKKWTIDEAAKKTELLLRAKRAVNYSTDKSITQDFVFGGIKIWLSKENQMNYKALYDSRDTLTYPVTIWADFGTIQELQLPDVASLSAFYEQGMAHIYSCLNRGLTEKKNLEQLTTEQLETFLQESSAQATLP